MKTPFNRRKPRSKDHIQPHTTFLKEQWGILSIRTNRTKVVCVSRLGHCAIPAKIRNRQEQPITIRDRRPRHRIASRYCLNTSQVCTNSPRAGYSSSSGVDCRPKTTSRDQRESVCVGELFAIIQRACQKGLMSRKDRSRCPTNLQECKK